MGEQEMMTWEGVALSIAAIGHDVRHPGRNNAFCIATSSHLATIYNDKSVLENMQVATCFQTMHKDPKQDTTQSWDQKMYRPFRFAVIEYILGTDMANHFDYLSRFRLRVA